MLVGRVLASWEGCCRGEGRCCCRWKGCSRVGMVHWREEQTLCNSWIRLLSRCGGSGVFESNNPFSLIK